MARGAAGGGAGAGADVLVQLDALLKFGEGLQAQYDAVLRYGAELAALGSSMADLSALGDFPEARMLMQRHRDASADLAEVLQEMRDAMDYAARVTRWVAGQYAALDQGTAEGIGATGNRVVAPSGSA